MWRRTNRTEFGWSEQAIPMPRRTAMLLIPLPLLLILTGLAVQAAHPEVGKLLSPPNLSSTGENIIVGMSLDSIPGFPLSASVETENISTAADGTTIVVSFRQRVFRDVRGRTRVDQDLNPVGEPPNPQLVTIAVYDPAHKTTVDLFPDAKTAIKTLLDPPKPRREQACAPIPRIEPSLLGKSLPSAPPEFHLDELAPDFIDGLKLRHGRQTIKYPAYSFGNKSAYSITTDFWYSQKWQAFVKVKQTGPGKTSHTVRLRDLRHEEPDPALFLIPDGYKITVSESQDCRLYLL
jgi:hypothetical protein